MSYVNKTVSINGTEIDFIKAFANELTLADSRITCETDIDAEFTNEDSSHSITIIFNVNNCYKLKLVRGYATGTCDRYKMNRVVNNIEYATTDLMYSASYTNSTDVSTRTLNFMLISNDNAIAILFGSYNQILPATYSYSVMSYHEQNFNIAACSNSSNTIASKSEFIRTDENHQGETYKITNRLSYSRDEDVEIIESKPLMQNNVAVHDMKNVYDCSNVLAGNILSFEDNRYFSIDSNTLIKI